MVDRAALGSYWAKFKTGTLWSSNGRCKGYAVSNPNESAMLDSYVNRIIAGGNPMMPVLVTATGQGLAGIVAAGMSPAPTPPTTFNANVVTHPRVGDTLTVRVG